MKLIDQMMRDLDMDQDKRTPIGSGNVKIDVIVLTVALIVIGLIIAIGA